MSQAPKKIFEYKEDMNGKMPAIVSWSFDYNYIACGGDKQLVYILDKRGKKLKEVLIPVNAKILQLEWDKDTEFLCIVAEGLNYVFLWAVFTANQIVQLEIDNPKAKVTFAKWSKTHAYLAIGSDKGGLMFYQKKQQKKVGTMGKHSKKVISGDWNNEGYLITGGEDRMLTVSNYNSDTIGESIPVKAEPKNIQWSRSKSDTRDVVQRTVTAIIAQKSIIMFELGKNQKIPDELVFENKYGKIVDYSLFGDGYIVAGFTDGWVAHISTHRKEIKDEVQSEKLFNSIDAISTNDTLYKLAVAGEGKIKMINLSSWQEIKNEQIELPHGYGRVAKLHWSQSGQILIVIMEKGLIVGFQTSVPTLNATCGQFLAIQQSFTEITIMETSQQQLIPISQVQLDNEPSQIVLGLQYFGASLNNIVSYFKYLDLAENKVLKQAISIQKKDYLGFVNQVMINDECAAVLSENSCIFHYIEPKEGQKDINFPDDQSKPIQHFGLTKNFLYLLDVQSKITIYNIKLYPPVKIIDYMNDNKIIKIFPNHSGTRCICLNYKGQGYLFEPAIDQMTLINEFPEKTDRIIWDQRDPNTFITLELNIVKVFIVNKNNIHSQIVKPVLELLSLEDILPRTKTEQKQLDICVTELDKGLQPLTLTNGNIKCFTQFGAIQSQALISHSYITAYKQEEDNNEGHFRYFLQNLALGKYANSFKAACNLKMPKIFDILGRRCLENLDFDVASKAFQKANNVSMVMMINSFQNETEKNLLFANVAMILGQHDLAQELFLQSSYKLGALELRSDIQDHVNALALAEKYAKDQKPFICKRLAMQIEAQGNNPDALSMYKEAKLDERKYEQSIAEIHNIQCLAGVARCSIKMGDIMNGTSLAREIKDSQILQDIALVCENMKQFIEAAELYEQAGVLEKAAALYIQQKMFKQATPLMNKIRSPKLLTLYAKAKESEQSYKEAENAYEKAEEWESVVRLNLNQLDNIEKAKFVLRNKCQTATLASMVAQYCEKRGSKAEAIEFLIMAGKKEEAFAIAQNYSEMDSYVDNMKAFSLEERLRVAQYYEGKGQLDKAAFHYDKAQDPMKALKLYQTSGEESIPDMIELVAKYKQENLIQNLLDYLTGETDDIPKDPYHTLKLYKKLNNLGAVGRIAITIASQEQEAGKYKEAHQILFEICDDLKSSGNQIPFDLYSKLLVLHSFILVKRVLKLEEHGDAAKLLDRVCKNISQFPQNAPNILTSAVVEASKSNQKALAFQWAITLMKPEYRSQINEKYKKSVENVARRPVKEEIQEVKNPCPFCQEFVGEFQLDCTKCSNNIPFCIASGKHIIADQCCLCPECKFPANLPYFKRILDIESTCPLCYKQINAMDLKEIGREEVLKLKRKQATE